MSPQTLLDTFVPPEGMVGHSAVLVAMTGTEGFLEDAVQSFTGLRPRQRAELGNILVYLMLDGHSSPSRNEVFPPGRIPGLHEFQPRSIAPGSLLHAKVALLAFASNRTSAPVHLRLAVLTANFTYTSARQQLELVWLVDVPLDGTARPEDRADVMAAGAFVEMLLVRRFHRDEQSLPPKDRKLTSRLDILLRAASSIATNRNPRFIHSLDRSLYDQIRERFRSAVDKPRNFLLCGSGFYEEPSGKSRKPVVFGKLEDLGELTPKAHRVALVEPSEAGAVAEWARAGDTESWAIIRPFDSLGQNRRLHAKFVYAGHIRNGYASNGSLYIGSGNLSRRGLLSHGGMTEGNVECGVVLEVNERLGPEELKQLLYWAQEHAESIDEHEWAIGQVGDVPDAESILEAPPILSASITTKVARVLRLLWRDDADETSASISWTGRDWFDLQRSDKVMLKDNENPTAIYVRDKTGRKWSVPVVDEAGRVGWQPSRFDSYSDALAALLDFPIRAAESTDDDDRDGDDKGFADGSGSGEVMKQEKSYAIHAAAELVEKVAALQVALHESMLDDWIDHLDRMFRASFPESLIATWRERRLDIFAHLREPELRSPHLTDRQRLKYFAVLDRAAHAWGLR